MFKYMLNFSRMANCMDPLPGDFGTMYFLYPSEDRHAKGFRVAGFGQRVMEKTVNLLRKKDSTRYFRPEKIY